MSEQIDTGGTAFARAATREMMEADEFTQSGMTLLDYFAGQSLAGFRAFNEMADPERAAQWAYNDACAMVAEKRRRERRRERNSDERD